jgi:hypothetical protein
VRAAFHCFGRMPQRKVFEGDSLIALPDPGCLGMRLLESLEKRPDRTLNVGFSGVYQRRKNLMRRGFRP